MKKNDPRKPKGGKRGNPTPPRPPHNSPGIHQSQVPAGGIVSRNLNDLPSRGTVLLSPVVVNRNPGITANPTGDPYGSGSSFIDTDMQAENLQNIMEELSPENVGSDLTMTTGEAAQLIQGERSNLNTVPFSASLSLPPLSDPQPSGSIVSDETLVGEHQENVAENTEGSTTPERYSVHADTGSSSEHERDIIRCSRRDNLISYAIREGEMDELSVEMFKRVFSDLNHMLRTYGLNIDFYVDSKEFAWEGEYVDSSYWVGPKEDYVHKDDVDKKIKTAERYTREFMELEFSTRTQPSRIERLPHPLPKLPVVTYQKPSTSSAEASGTIYKAVPASQSSNRPQIEELKGTKKSNKKRAKIHVAVNNKFKESEYRFTIVTKKVKLWSSIDFEEQRNFILTYMRNNDISYALQFTHDIEAPVIKKVEFGNFEEGPN